jgi:hypothetical protein
VYVANGIPVSNETRIITGSTRKIRNTPELGRPIDCGKANTKVIQLITDKSIKAIERP